MLIVPGHETVYFDVDGTLIEHCASKSDDSRAVQIEMPTTMGVWDQWAIPHEKHIQQLKRHKEVGHTVIVWSAGGWDWAHSVVKTLKLEEYVDLVISKPMHMYDDLDPKEWLPSRTFYQNKKDNKE